MTKLTWSRGPILALEPVIEEAIGKYTEWLNLWDKDAGGDFQITRDAYEDYDDAPKVLIYTHDLVVLLVNPYHDEGGSHELTVFLDYDDGGRYRQPNVEPNYRIRAIIQDFDTYLTEIYNSTVPNPGFRHLPEED